MLDGYRVILITFFTDLKKRMISMKCSKTLNVMAALTALVVAGAVRAGPEVTITFKNNSNSLAVYDVVGSSAYSYAEADPKPSEEVVAGGLDTFRVKGAQSPDVTTTSFQYSIGTKVCKFKTSYVKIPAGRVARPDWRKSAESFGGARCDVTVTSTNAQSHDWSVEYTMR